MPFPEWGHSYNALYVPLHRWGWQCALMPAHEVQEVDRAWALSYEERKEKRKQQKEQIEQDRQDFDHLFNVRIDRREAASSTAFRAYIGFITKNVLASGRSVPNDGQGITRVLRNAVRDGFLVPVIDRAWRGGQTVSRRYAPQNWNKAASGGSHVRSEKIYTAAEFAVLRRANGETGGFGLLAQHARVGSAQSFAANASSGSFDWLSAVKSAGSALTGTGLDSTHGNSILKNFGDAQPFEYQPDALSDEVIEMAARGMSAADEAACDAMYEARMTYCSALSKMYGGDARTYLACKEQAFQDYQACRGYL